MARGGSQPARAMDALDRSFLACSDQSELSATQMSIEANLAMDGAPQSTLLLPPRESGAA